MSEEAPQASGRTLRRVSPRVALALLEMIRSQDLPAEVLESEDMARTMPRRLGLSEVLERQIQRHREDLRKRRRISDEEVRDLVRLVIRRPDADEVFFRTGAHLSGDPAPGGLVMSILPRAVAYALARRRVTRLLKQLFGRRIGGFGSGPFTLEGRAHLFIQSDPGGDACHFLSGFCQGVLRRYAGDDVRVAHVRCQSRRDELCRWTVLAEERVRSEEGLEGLLMNPEPRAG